LTVRNQKDRFASHYGDFEATRTLLDEFTKSKDRQLSAEERERMLRLLETENPVAVEAAAVLAAYAQRDAKLHTTLRGRIGRLAKNVNVHVNRAALNLAKWLKDEGIRGQLAALRHDLASRVNKTDDEIAFEAELDTYMKNGRAK
jgi:transposase